MTKLLLPLALVVTSVSFGSAAQTAAPGNDASYCAALTDKYQKYVGGSGSKRFTSDIDSEVAMAKCKGGDTAAGIPVLESKLRAARIDLPPRG